MTHMVADLATYIIITPDALYNINYSTNKLQYWLGNQKTKFQSTQLVYYRDN